MLGWAANTPSIGGTVNVRYRCGLEVHGICNCRLVCSEVVEARSDCKKSHLWYFGNITCGDSTGTNWIEKYLVRVLPGLA